MSATIFVNKLPQYKSVLYRVYDDALKETATDVLIEAKMKAPFKTGHLRAPSEPIKDMGKLRWRVGFDARYAAYQEAGGDGNRVVRKYTTSGTGKHFLKNSGDRNAKLLAGKFKKHSQRVSV